MCNFLDLGFGYYLNYYDTSSSLDISESFVKTLENILYPYNFATAGDLPSSSGMDGSSSGHTAISGGVYSSFNKDIDFFNEKIEYSIKSIINLKNNLITYSAKNNIRLLIGDDGLLTYESLIKYDGPMHIKTTEIQVQVEKLINLNVKAELFQKDNDCTIVGLNHSTQFLMDLVRTFPVVNETELNTCYQESLTVKGDRFIHDPLNRPAGYDPLIDRTPSPEALENTSHVIDSNKREGDTSLNQQLKIRKTIQEQLPINSVFKKP